MFKSFRIKEAGRRHLYDVSCSTPFFLLSCLLKRGYIPKVPAMRSIQGIVAILLDCGGH